MGTNLKYVKVKDISQIPRHLFEQVKPAEFDIDRLYEWAPILLNNPMNIMGAFIDKEQAVKGVLWTSYNPISNKVQVHIVSIDREYHGRGFLKEVNGILKKLKKQVGASQVIGTTTRPKAIAKAMGFQESKLIIMEK